MSDPCLAGFVLGVGVLKGQAESGVRATRSWSWSWTGWKPALGLASRAGRPRNRRACRQQASELRPPRGSPVPVRERKAERTGTWKPASFPLSPGSHTSITRTVPISFPIVGGGAKERTPFWRVHTSLSTEPASLPPPLPRPSDYVTVAGRGFLLATRIAQVKLYKQLAGSRARGLRRGHGRRRHRQAPAARAKRRGSPLGRGVPAQRRLHTYSTISVQFPPKPPFSFPHELKCRKWRAESQAEEREAGSGQC